MCTAPGQVDWLSSMCSIRPCTSASREPISESKLKSLRCAICLRTALRGPAAPSFSKARMPRASTMTG